jgi:hypothetical protein
MYPIPKNVYTMTIGIGMEKEIWANELISNSLTELVLSWAAFGDKERDWECVILEDELHGARFIKLQNSSNFKFKKNSEKYHSVVNELV